MPRGLHGCRDVQIHGDATLGIDVTAANGGSWELVEVCGLAGVELVDADVVGEPVDDGLGACGAVCCEVGEAVDSADGG